jgi:ribosomal protein S18 acetylase RimI-like enzyme
MIVLRNLSATEFADYRAYFVADYAREIISNYAETPARAEAIARADMDENFPAGVPVGANELVGIDWVVDEISTHVGYLWYTIDGPGRSAFICDFYILAPQRSRGYGRLTIELLEAQLLAAGVTQLQLRVAHDNQRALRLYQEIGFFVTGHNMLKRLASKA